MEILFLTLELVPPFMLSLVPVLSSRISFLLNTLRLLNRNEIKKWIANSRDKFDWSRYFKYITVLEGLRYCY